MIITSTFMVGIIVYNSKSIPGLLWWRDSTDQRLSLIIERLDGREEVIMLILALEVDRATLGVRKVQQDQTEKIRM